MRFEWHSFSAGMTVDDAWQAILSSPRHICTRRTLLMQLTEQCERFPSGR